MIEVHAFNSVGDVICRETFVNESGAHRMARIAFSCGHGVAINGRDCYTFAEAERALRADRIVAVAA